MNDDQKPTGVLTLAVDVDGRLYPVETTLTGMWDGQGRFVVPFLNADDAEAVLRIVIGSVRRVKEERDA